MRTTIHLIPTDDAGWWLPLFEPGIESWSRRRLEQLGLPSRSRRQGASRDREGARRGGPAHPARGGGARGRAAGVKLNAQTGMHMRSSAVGHLGDRLPRARSRQDHLPGSTRGLARQAAAVRPRPRAGGARAPLPGRLRTRHRSRLRLLVRPAAARRARRARVDLRGDRGGPSGGGGDARHARRAPPASRDRPGPDARQFRHLPARLEGPRVLGRGRARGARQGGRRGLDPPGDPRGRDRRRRLALLAEGRPPGDQR